MAGIPSRARLQTSVADIVEAIDGPLTLTACADEHEACDQYSKCNIRDPLHRIRERIASSLAECSVADLAADRTVSAPAAAPARLWTTRGDSSQGSA